MTTVIVYAPIAGGDLKDNLGKPEYSYTFVLDHFRPALERLGDVVAVRDPATEVDPLYDAAVARGEQCVFLCFAPPHRAPTGLRCPTSTVFAWEFDTIPDEAWGGDPRNDWRTVLADHGRAIVLSRHSVAAVKAAMGDDFPVRAIPAPVFDQVRPISHPMPEIGPRQLSIHATTIDSREFEFTDSGLRSPALAERFGMQPWDGSAIDLTFTADDRDEVILGGFYASEPWGTWSRVADPWVLLPQSVRGPVEITLVAHGHGHNLDREITVQLGDTTRRFRLTARRRRIRLRFAPTEPASILQFSGFATTLAPEVADERTMGIGLSRLSLRRPSLVPQRVAERLRRWRGRDARPAFRATARDESIELAGVTYTSVFNPVDARKNWELIIYSFCWAFRDEPDATLLLKMSHHSITSFFSNLQSYLHRVGPVKCRVLAVHGLLSEEDFHDLMEATTYYVNASTAEGLCMPLMEFMSAGIPAVAPDNTAMADYVTPESTFVVASSPAAAPWPHDERLALRSRHNRVDGMSLADAFADSFAVATDDAARYRQAGQVAREKMRDIASIDTVSSQLRNFLGLVGDTHE